MCIADDHSKTHTRAITTACHLYTCLKKNSKTSNYGTSQKPETPRGFWGEKKRERAYKREEEKRRKREKEERRGVRIAKGRRV